MRKMHQISCKIIHNQSIEGKEALGCYRNICFVFRNPASTFGKVVSAHQSTGIVLWPRHQGLLYGAGSK